MPKVQTGVDLLPYNTFKVSVKAGNFLQVNTPSDIPTDKALVLGGGANILFTKDFDGLIVKNNLLGKKVVKEEDKEVTIEAASGEDWLELVNWAVDQGFSGLEHMAYIPGTVGGALVGNIGAYGQTFEEIFVSARAGKEIITKDQCHFGYRESTFKHKLKDLFIETVTLKLSRSQEAKKIAQETTVLRQAKLPNWKVLGTAGSFFKNPFVSPGVLTKLISQFPDLPNYPNSQDPLIKISAGYLLEKLGWKGKRMGNVGTYEKHALIVVNYGGATGQEILDFTQQMQADVKKSYDIDIEPEVNVI